jgi:hypothetical protein
MTSLPTVSYPGVIPNLFLTDVSKTSNIAFGSRHAGHPVETLVVVRCCHLDLWESCLWGFDLHSPFCSTLNGDRAPCEGQSERFPWEPELCDCASQFYSLKFIFFDYVILGRIRSCREVCGKQAYLLSAWESFLITLEFSAYLQSS